MNTKSMCAVVGVDLGYTGDDALMEALGLLETGVVTRLHLLYVVDPKAYASASTGVFENAERALEQAPKSAERRAQTICRLQGIDVDITKLVGHARIGEPAATLLQMCVDYDADVLVIGTHGRTGLDRLLDGSVAEAVIRRARCPVVVARRKDYAGIPKTTLPDAPRSPEEMAQAEAHVGGHVQTSTTLDSWHPADNGPTGFRIV
jgi:universal stress protein A